MLAWVARWGAVGLFVVLFAEEAGLPLPVPGDVFIMTMGAAARASRASFVPTAIAVICAVLAGSSVLFEISRRLGNPLLLKIGRRLGFDADRADRVGLWLARRGTVAIVIGRLTPGLRIVLTVAAGALRMDRTAFLLGTLVASALWVALDYWLGFLLGVGVAGALGRFVGRTLHDPAGIAVLIVVILLAAAALVATIFWRRKRARRKRSRVGA
jgi:membrane protein DedA with SNARE-associated domain